MLEKNLFDFFRSYLPQKNAIFVFPSSIIARKWEEFLVENDFSTSLPNNRFIVWDNFKEQTFLISHMEEKPVNTIIRKLYAKSIIAENAHQPFLEYFIPKSFATSAQNFSDWLSSIFSELGMWKKKSNTTDLTPEANDLNKIYNRYSTFLTENKLFEPSWEDNAFIKDKNHYFILFPNTITDFSEFRSILQKEESVTILDSCFSVEPKNCCFYSFADTRKQLNFITLKMEELHNLKKIPYEEMAISLTDLQIDAFYLKQELSLRNIPFTILFGSPLGKTFAGRFFSLIQNCYASNYSFETVKALLLNKLIPWKEREMAYNLISWGISQHCVISWKENGQYFKTWEESFKKNSSTDQRFQNVEFVSEIKKWFLKLKQNINSLCLSPDFTTLETSYHMFREQMLDVSQLNQDDNNTIARCIKEMQNLETTVALIPSLKPENPFSIFVSHIDTCQYVKKQENIGVSIYPYKVAAGSPFKIHFLISASQANATVIEKKLDFLSDNYKSKLKLSSANDLSTNFFEAYQLGSPEGMYFTFAEKTFTDYQIPHVYFSNTKKIIPQIPSDPIFEENKGKPSFNSIYPIQKEGFLQWKKFNEKTKDYRDSLVYKPIKSENFLKHFISTERFIENKVKVSQSDLKVFHLCPTKWLFSYALSLKELITDASLIDEATTGTIAHKALEIIFEKIKNDNLGIFSAQKKDEYYNLIDNAISESISKNREFEGPLAKPLLEAISSNAKSKTKQLLDNEIDSDFAENWKIIDTELSLSIPYNNLVMKGKIDRVSKCISGEYANETAIIDYKTNKAPAAKDIFINDTQPEKKDIKDFQIPFYVWLYETIMQKKDDKFKIEYSAFNEKDGYREVIKSIKGRKTTKTREEFQPEIDFFLEIANDFGEKVKALNFTRPKGLPYKECRNCTSKALCRFAYYVK